MIIRKADKSDKIELQKLMIDLENYRKWIFTNENKKFHEKKTNSILKDYDFDESIIFICFSELWLAIWFIYGTIHERKNNKLDKLWFIDELYVKSEYRLKWIAKSLFIELENEFRNKSCNHIITHTDFENELSNNFYSKLWMNNVTLELWKEI